MKWKEKSILDKVTSVIVILCSVCIIILALLQLFSVWENAMFAYMPLACVNMVVFAISCWKTNRSVAVFNLFAAIVMLLCILVIVLIK